MTIYREALARLAEEATPGLWAAFRSGAVGVIRDSGASVDPSATAGITAVRFDPVEDA